MEHSAEEWSELEFAGPAEASFAGGWFVGLVADAQYSVEAHSAIVRFVEARQLGRPLEIDVSPEIAAEMEWDGVVPEEDDLEVC